MREGEELGQTGWVPPGVFLLETWAVYQKALVLAERVVRVTSGFGRNGWQLANQLNRSSLSVALNIAEGNGRGTGLDKRRFLLIARGSVPECVAALEVCKRLVWSTLTRTANSGRICTRWRRCYLQ